MSLAIAARRAVKTIIRVIIRYQQTSATTRELQPPANAPHFPPMHIIEVDRLTKEYRLGAMQGLKQTLLNTAARLTGRKVAERTLFKALDRRHPRRRLQCACLPLRLARIKPELTGASGLT